MSTIKLPKSRAEVEEIFGNPNPWQRTGSGRHVKIYNPCFPDIYGKTKPLFWGKSYMCHKYMIPYLETFYDMVNAENLIAPEPYKNKNYSKQYLPKITKFGCLSQRIITDSGNPGRLSYHTWGIAFDINSSWIDLGIKERWNPNVLDPRIIQIATYEIGFHWLGNFDAMHFELTNIGRKKGINKP